MLFTIIIAVIAFVSAVITLVIVAKEGKGKQGWGRWGPIGVILCTILTITVQGIQQCRSDDSHSKELSEAQCQYETLKRQNDSLCTQINGLTTANQEMKDMLAPVVAMADEKDQTVEMFLKGIHGIMNPKLIFLEDRTETNKDNKTGLWTTYTWSSQYPATIRDATVKLRFDTIILKSQFNVDNGTLSIDPDGKGVHFYARTLGTGCDIAISVCTETPPKILSCEFSP